jgi:gp16 family phage-associated protein
MATFLMNESEHMQEALRTPTQVQTWFRESGVSVVDWAARNGFSPALVYAVIKGRRKCLRGESHDIAVALGMKHGLPQS